MTGGVAGVAAGLVDAGVAAADCGVATLAGAVAGAVPGGGAAPGGRRAGVGSAGLAWAGAAGLGCDAGLAAGCGAPPCGARSAVRGGLATPRAAPGCCPALGCRVPPVAAGCPRGAAARVVWAGCGALSRPAVSRPGVSGPSVSRSGGRAPNNRLRKSNSATPAPGCVHAEAHWPSGREGGPADHLRGSGFVVSPRMPRGEPWRSDALNAPPRRSTGDLLAGCGHGRPPGCLYGGRGRPCQPRVMRGWVQMRLARATHAAFLR